MEQLFLILNIFVWACSTAGFVYGILKFLRPRKALYAQMITFAVGCIAFGRLYQIVRLFTGDNITERFQLGILGVIGSFLFLFTSNYGTVDSLADDGSDRFRKYRLISLAAPVTLILIYVILILIPAFPLLNKIATGVIVIVASASSYFNLKHLILPDVDYGVVKCLKPYNALALVHTAVCVLEPIALSYNSTFLFILSNVVMGITLLVMVPVVERGQKKWTT